MDTLLAPLPELRDWFGTKEWHADRRLLPAYSLILGIKGYWDFAGSRALGILAGTVAVGFVVAIVLRPMIVSDN